MNASLALSKRRKNKIKNSSSERVYSTVCTVLCTVWALLCLYPMLYCLIISVTPGKIMDANNGVVLWFPLTWSWAGYKQILLGQNYIWTSMIVTVLRTVCASALHLLVCTLAGYAISRKGLPGRKPYMIFMMITVLFGAGLIPGYLNIQELGLLNSFWVMVIPGAFSAYDTLIFKQFFEGIPSEIEEAAQVDGVSELQLFARIIVPLSKPVVAAIGLFTVIGNWTAWFDAYLYISPAYSNLWPLQTYVTLSFNNLSANSNSAVASMLEELNNAGLGVSELSVKMALTVIAIIPVLLIYPFFQKYFSQGVYLGAVKG